MSNTVLLLAKKLYFHHYILFVHLINSRKRIQEIDRRVELMHQWLFGKENNR